MRKKNVQKYAKKEIQFFSAWTSEFMIKIIIFSTQKKIMHETQCIQKCHLNMKKVKKKNTQKWEREKIE